MKHDRVRAGIGGVSWRNPLVTVGERGREWTERENERRKELR
jgi:hypothetical protein